jgi:hypothetical protein
MVRVYKKPEQRISAVVLEKVLYVTHDPKGEVVLDWWFEDSHAFGPGEDEDSEWWTWLYYNLTVSRWKRREPTNFHYGLFKENMVASGGHYFVSSVPQRDKEIPTIVHANFHLGSVSKVSVVKEKRREGGE